MVLAGPRVADSINTFPGWQHLLARAACTRSTSGTDTGSKQTWLDEAPKKAVLHRMERLTCSDAASFCRCSRTLLISACSSTGGSMQVADAAVAPCGSSRAAEGTAAAVCLCSCAHTSLGQIQQGCCVSQTTGTEYSGKQLNRGSLDPDRRRRTKELTTPTSTSAGHTVARVPAPLSTVSMCKANLWRQMLRAMLTWLYASPQDGSAAWKTALV